MSQYEIKKFDVRSLVQNSSVRDVNLHEIPMNFRELSLISLQGSTLQEKLSSLKKYV